MDINKIIFHEFKMEISVNGKMIILAYGDILYIVAEKPYCKVYCHDKHTCLVSYSLDRFVKILPDIFFRCSKSTIVNLSRIKEYSSQEIFMCDGSVVRISRRKTDLFRTSIITVPRLTVPFDKCFSCNSEDICCKSFRAKLIGTDENIFPKSL